MIKRKKIYKKCIYATILILIGFVITSYIFKEPKEYLDSKYKIHTIEESIYSSENNEKCLIPNLPLDNPEIMRFYKPTEPLECGYLEDDWVICEQSICSVKEAVRNLKGNIICTYQDILRKTDYKLNYGKVIKTKDIYILKDSDFARVNCKAQNGDKWFGLAIGIRDSLGKNLEKIHTKNKKYNVLMFGFDSLSRNAFIRKLPKSYRFLTKTLKSIILQGYNIVGDGTPQALIPLLTGYNELELPETRKRISGSGFVDLYPFIWNDFENDNYVTSFNEDLPNYGTFTYRLNGFARQPTDHYMRTFYLDLENYLRYYKANCIGNRGSHHVMMEYTKNFMLKYSNYARFIFSFHGDLSHDSINLIGAADSDFLDWLKILKDKGTLNDTILIIMSDHGNRFADVRNTLQGKQEERLPFFSFNFPESFQHKFPVHYNNFKENAKNRLLTPYDIHATLKDLLHLQAPRSNASDKNNKKNKLIRSMSLFGPISKNRSCLEAYIEPHWCSCLRWHFINDTRTDFVQQIGFSVLNTINEYTKPFRSICEELKILEIDWAMKMLPKDELLKFKTNKDMDGYLADLSSKMEVYNQLFQIKLTTIPGNAIFEASVNHNLINNDFNVEITYISRINKYGEQAKCIYDINPELRKFCYCKV